MSQSLEHAYYQHAIVWRNEDLARVVRVGTSFLYPICIRKITIKHCSFNCVILHHDEL